MPDRASFDEFVGARWAALLRTCYLLTHDRGTAEDLLQTALLKSWRAWSRLAENPEPYVRRVIVNTYASGWRRRWRGELPHATLPGESLPDRSGLDQDVADRDLLWRALAELPRRQRAVVVLRYFEDLSEAEVAQLLGVSTGTVKSQASKALAHLRVQPALNQAVKGPLP